MLKEAELREGKREALKNEEDELRVLELLAKGRTKQAEALERELRLKEEVKRLVEETTLSEEEALALARKKMDLEDEVARRENGGRKIRGYSQDQGARRGFGGLAEFDAMQKRGALSPSTPGLDERNRLQDRSQKAFLEPVARRNAQRDNQRGDGAPGKPLAKTEELLVQLKEEVVRLGG
jgi:hypothetical protein